MPAWRNEQFRSEKISRRHCQGKESLFQQRTAVSSHSEAAQEQRGTKANDSN